MQRITIVKPKQERSSRFPGLLSRALLERVRALHPARRSEHGSEAGVAIVEFALILPLLLVMLLLILDFGRAINYWIDTTHLASEGARLAAVDKAPGGSLQEHIKAQADTPELQSGGAHGVVPPGVEVCVEYPEGTPEVGDPVKVTVRADYNWLPLVSDEFDITQSTISGSASHRIERVSGVVEPGCVS